MTIILPDRESVELLHDTVLSLSGGKPGIHNENLITGAIQRPLTYVQYVENYDLDTVCAVLIDSIARNHGYKDGNKRTALMTAIFTYRVNGVHFKATQKMNIDFDHMVMWVVNQKPSIDEIVEKLKDLRAKHEGEEETWGAMFLAFVHSKIGQKHK